MCVAYPVQIKSVEGDAAVISFQETEQEVSVELLDNVKPGDYVIVHAGFAIEKMGVAEAEETIALLTQLTEPPPGNDPPSPSEGSTRSDLKDGTAP